MKQSDTTIEQLTVFSSTDADSIRRLTSKLGPGFQALSDEDLKEMLESKNTHLFVARVPQDQKIIGMITLAVYRIPYVKKAYLDDVVVDEKYRGHGLGSKLLNYAIDEARKLGATYIDLTSNPTRVESNRLYEKLGFKKRDTNVYRLNYDKS